jgi:hypothetical protein
MQNSTGKFFSKLIVVVTMFAVIAGLGAISIASLWQTESSFQPLNDPTLIVGGFALGAYISWAFAFIFQYTQNAALYIRKHFCTGKKVYESEVPFLGWEIELTDYQIADFAFWVSAFIDALTNVVWFYRTVEIPTDLVLGWMLRIIGYSAMIVSVGVEEAMGIVLDALKRSIGELFESMKPMKKMGQQMNNKPQQNNNPSRQEPRPSEQRPNQNQQNFMRPVGMNAKGSSGQRMEEPHMQQSHQRLSSPNQDGPSYRDYEEPNFQ